MATCFLVYITLLNIRHINNNNNNQIYIAPYGRNFRGAANTSATTWWCQLLYRRLLKVKQNECLVCLCCWLQRQFVSYEYSWAGDVHQCPATDVYCTTVSLAAGARCLCVTSAVIISRHSSSVTDAGSVSTSWYKLCERPPQCAPTPCKLTFDLLTLKVVSKSRVTWSTSVTILVFLGLSVLDLGPMYATDRRQTRIIN